LSEEDRRRREAEEENHTSAIEQPQIIPRSYQVKQLSPSRNARAKEEKPTAALPKRVKAQAPHSPVTLVLEFSKKEQPNSKRKAIPTIAPGFSPVEEAEQPVTKKRRLPPKIEEVRSVIEQIPTEKAELFAYEIDWDVIDQNKIVQTKMRPWVTKKIVEYLGEEEGTLIEYICKKISEHKKPQEILEQLSLVLDEEASVFVVKMWRMLIFHCIEYKTMPST